MVVLENIIKDGHRDLLENVLDKMQIKDYEIGNHLSDEQKNVFEKFKKGDNICILGAAGSGKSMIIKTIQEYNMQFSRETFYKKIYMTATTGVAAYNLNFSNDALASSGMTIHSFLGIGTGSQHVYDLVKRINKSPNIVNLIKSDHILVIDEISLLSAELFEKINLIYRHFRKSKNYFGGIQVFLTGDFLQTEAIFNDLNYNVQVMDKRLLFESELFNEMFPEPMIFNKNHRQKDDTSYYELLSRIRIGKHTQEDIQLLNNKCQNYEQELKETKKKGITPLNLVISNALALQINKKNMDNIKQDYTYYNYSVTKFGHNSDLLKTMENDLEKQFNTKGLLKLALKVNSRVMLIRNIDVAMGLINGSMGVITHLYKTEITVSFDNGNVVNIPKTEWMLDINNNWVKFKQLPIICAYAITIHKSISLTLDNVICDLDKAFCNHLVYLALSRIRSFDKLLLKSFNPNKITVNQKILKYLKYT
jgi:ATP-dependent DNA helicase PIF1